MDFDFQKSNMKLEITKLIIEAWQENRKKMTLQKDSEIDFAMKQLIRNQVEIEWGKSTVAVFDENSLSVKILNFDGREKIFDAPQ
jgi:hypothetical protein